MSRSNYTSGWSGGGGGGSSGSGGVRGIKCFSCGLYHRSTNCTTKCFQCGNIGHIAANCTRCSLCKAWGHVESACPVPVCPVCNGGHWKQDCPNAGPYAGRNAWGGPDSCSHCGSTSHFQNTCPEVQAYINRSK